MLTLVVAHPDDEALWFSSVAVRAAKVIMCFLGGSGLALQRRLAIRDHPLDCIVPLGLRQSGAFRHSDWKFPVETDVGLEIVRDDRVRRRYADNFHALVKLLGPELRDSREVFTHNPWGEYGHEEHVQVYRAVRTLQDSLSFDLWVNNYSSDKSVSLLQEYLCGQYVRYETHQVNTPFAERTKSVYLRHGAWTWQDDYEWFREESFLLNLAKNSSPRDNGHLCPINMLRILSKEHKR
jgi:LmbE family N-acetylglucosaminyl deacetylase